MSRELRAQRLRLLALAGVVAPLVMILIGYILGVALRDEWLDLWRLPGWRSVLYGVATAVLSMGMVYGLYRSSPFFERALKESGVKVGEEALRMAGYPVMFVVVSAAGLGEEILFRGGLQPTIGIIPTALLFGFSHGGWRREMWAYALAASGSGALFGLAYKMTGDLWVPIIAHVLHNIAATVLLGQEDEEDEAEEMTGVGLPADWAAPEADSSEREDLSEWEYSDEPDVGLGSVDPAEPEPDGSCSDEAGGAANHAEAGEPVPDETDDAEPGPEDRKPGAGDT